MSNTIITSDGKHHYIDKDEDRDKIDYEAGHHIVRAGCPGSFFIGRK